MASSSRPADASSSEDMAALTKNALRKRIGATLKALADDEVAAQSQRLAEKLVALPEFTRAKGVSVYLEMPKEAATGKLLEAAFEANKKVFVPKITGRWAEDLKMLRAQSLVDIRSFPKVRPGAPERGGGGCSVI
jgi:5-formyltetrahydrofolate cyclo-ligase